jgi:hypothetical protein
MRRSLLLSFGFLPRLCREGQPPSLGASMIAKPASVGGDLLAVSAKSHTAPTAMMRFGTVSEPEHARAVLTPFHQLEVGRRQQISSRFSHGRKNRLGRIFSPDFFDVHGTRLVPNKPGVTLRSRQKTVENGRISPPSSLSAFDEGANILTQRSRGI